MHASMFGGGGTCLSQSAVRMNGEWPQYQVSTGRCPLVVASCPTTPSPSPSPLLGTAQSPRSPVGIKHQLSHHSSMLCVKLIPVVTIFYNLPQNQKMLPHDTCECVSFGSESSPGWQQQHQLGAFWLCLLPCPGLSKHSRVSQVE